MSGELALRLIRAIRTGTESEVIHDIFQNSSSTESMNSSSPTTIADEIDIVPYKCLCPYSTSSTDGNLKTQLKKLTKFVKNIPCDRPCPVNLYRHLRNYHKVDLQHAKDITRTIMLTKTGKSDDVVHVPNTIKKRVKLSNNYETTLPFVHVELSNVKSEEKSSRSFCFLFSRIFIFCFI